MCTIFFNFHFFSSFFIFHFHFIFFQFHSMKWRKYSFRMKSSRSWWEKRRSAWNLLWKDWKLKLTCTQQGNMQQQRNMQQQGTMQQGTMSFDTQLCLYRWIIHINAAVIKREHTMWLETFSKIFFSHFLTVIRKILRILSSSLTISHIFSNTLTLLTLKLLTLTYCKKNVRLKVKWVESYVRICVRNS